MVNMPVVIPVVASIARRVNVLGPITRLYSPAWFVLIRPPIWARFRFSVSYNEYGVTAIMSDAKLIERLNASLHQKPNV